MWEDDEDDMDWNMEDEDDAEATVPEVGGLTFVKCPSVNGFEDNIFIKQESSDDIRGMLDAWEELDNNFASLKVMEVVTEAAGLGSLSPHLKGKEPDFWGINQFSASSPLQYGLLAEDFISPIEDGIDTDDSRYRDDFADIC